MEAACIVMSHLPGCQKLLRGQVPQPQARVRTWRQPQGVGTLHLPCQRHPSSSKSRVVWGCFWPWKYVQGEGQWKQSPPAPPRPALPGKNPDPGDCQSRGRYSQPISQQPANSDADLGNSTSSDPAPSPTKATTEWGAVVSCGQAEVQVQGPEGLRLWQVSYPRGA